MDWLERWDRWIMERIDPATGAARDPYSGSPLRFQYHYCALLLGMAFGNDKKKRNMTEHLWRYFGSISWSEQEVSLEFNAYLLSLLHFRQTGAHGDAAKEYLCAFPLPSRESLDKRNTNFTFMLYYSLNYLREQLGIQRDERLEAYCRERVEAACLDDGFIVDTPASGSHGYASLVYHAKMASVLLCNGFVNEDAADLRRGQRAIEVLLDLGATDEVLSYGRSQASLFGYANLYLALRILERTDGADRWRLESEKILGLLREWQMASGEIALNPACDNSRRIGFDPYMHVVVYNAYAWGIMRFADRLGERESEQHGEPGEPAELPRHSYYPGGGLLSYASPRYRLLLSTRRFQKCAKLRSDPRYQCLVPQFLQAGEKRIVPGIPVDYGSYVRMAHAGGTVERIKRFCSKAGYALRQIPFHNFLDKAGFFPCFLSGEKVIVCAGTQRRLEVREEEKEVTVESEFAFDAVARTFGILNTRRGGDVRGLEASLEVALKLTETTMRYDFVVSIQRNDFAKPRLMHFNARLAEGIDFCIGKDGRSLDLGNVARIRHSEDLHALEVFDVPGAMGVARFARCAMPVETAGTIRLWTEWEFF